MNAYVYILIDPRDFKVRYVGKTKNLKRRYDEHIRHLHKHTHKTHWIKSLVVDNLLPILQVVECVDETCIDWYETWWIVYGRVFGWDLTNATYGGEGLLNPSDETKRKIGEANKRRIITEETRLKLSLSHKGKTYTRKGQPSFIGQHHTKETKEKISKHNKNNKYRAKVKANQVIEIRALLSLGLKHKDIAELYNVSRSVITDIHNHKTWSDIGE